ncbi:MAG: DUF2520 domain-containing protein [Prevotellaceae bacterium]|jgi:predicted short-subunit dehydrogenase-like oxidoreductase (DUF2520 family)|nr:DUF2520 domain-containing protein [Prevotellaceae bacterium]
MVEVVIIGAGNLATHLGEALPKEGFRVVQIYSRTESAALALAFRIGADFTANPAEIYPDADLYIYAVTDDALPDVIRAVNTDRGLHVHTSGCQPVTLFEGIRSCYGVCYPFQTFSAGTSVNFRETPLFLEASDTAAYDRLLTVGRRISNNVFPLDSDGRRRLHLAGVFASNFTNALYVITEKILAEQGISFRVALPLIREGVAKLNELSPADAQTGPAIRGDSATLAAHLDLLAGHPEWQKLYKLISHLISDR